MIIFNVTTIVEDDIQSDFQEFMHNTYFPSVLATGKFVEAKLFKLTDPINEGVTFCAQYYANSVEELESYKEEYFPNLSEILYNQFINKAVSFNSTLQHIKNK